MTSTGGTLLFGLIGDPVSHSLSPFIMNRAFADIGMDAVYAAFGVKPSQLPTAIGGLAALGAMGLNVTYPYKEEVLYHLDVVASDAELVHSVNTIVFYEDEIHGYNTDAPGTAMALEQFADVTLEKNAVFIFGAGGSARAAAYGLLERGVERLTFGVRSPAKVEMVIDNFAYAFPEQYIDYVLLNTPDNLSRRREAIAESGIVINATPAGMAGVAENTLLIEDVSWIRPGQCYFDFVYHPRRTPFLDAAQEAGAKTLGGIALLVSQAAESFRLWTDQTFDIKSMAEAVESFSHRGPAIEGVN